MPALTLPQLEDKYFPPGSVTAVRHSADTLVIPHVDGDAYFNAIADALDECKGPGDRIYVTSWVLNREMPLRLASGVASLGDRLVEKAALGADVRVIVATPRWATEGMNPAKVDYFLGAVTRLPQQGTVLARIVSDNIRAARALRAAKIGNSAPLDGRVLMDWGGFGDSRHEKATIVFSATTNELRAFVGGIDYALDRVADELHTTSRWHDAGVELRAGAAVAVFDNFCTRWEEAATLPAQSYIIDGVRESFKPSLEVTPPTLPAQPIQPASSSAADGQYLGASVRILRSYDNIRAFSYWWNKPHLPWQTLPAGGVREILTILQNAISKATRYVYVEDQSLNPKDLGQRVYMSHRLLYPIVSAACANDIKVIFVCDGWTPPPAVANLSLSEEIRDRILTPLTPQQRQNFALYMVTDTKVHAKIVLVDDEFVSIGSANFWDRSMTGVETELNAAIVHPSAADGRSLASDLRVRLWRGHLRVSPSTAIDAELLDLEKSLGIFRGTWGTGVTFDRPNNAFRELPA